MCELQHLKAEWNVMLVGASTYNLCLFKQAHWEGVAVYALKKWLGDILGN